MTYENGQRQSFGKRTRMITVRVTIEEYARIQLAGRVECISMNKFCRRELLSAADYVLLRSAASSPLAKLKENQ